MVFNVTKDDSRVRMAAIDEDIWPQTSVTEKLPADPIFESARSFGASMLLT